MYNIIRPVNLKPKPDKYEELVAELCAKYFCSDIAFVIRSSTKTPDITVLKTGQNWEIKNLRGNGRHTIEDNLRKASKQSKNIIVSLLRSPMNARQAEARIKHALNTANYGLKHVALVTKSGKIIMIR